MMQMIGPRIASGELIKLRTGEVRGGVSMRCQRFATLLILFSIFTTCVFAQGLNTTASRDDWEEINFEFNSHILTDGYPSLLRLAELLQKHPDYRVKLEGHADVIGSNRYN